MKNIYNLWQNINNFNQKEETNLFFKVNLSALFLSVSLFAGVESRYLTIDLLNSETKIIDIRTESEWWETGLIKGSYPITFFDERGNYDVSIFLTKLKKIIKPNEQFALICRTGNRTKNVADFLGKNGYEVINLQGGIIHAIKNGIKPDKYDPVQKVQ